MKARSRLLAATVIAFGGLAAVAITASFFFYLPKEWVGITQFTAVVLSMPWALYVMLLYPQQTRNLASRTRMAWRLAPLRRLSTLSLAMLLIVTVAWIRTSYTSDMIYIPFGSRTAVLSQDVGYVSIAVVKVSRAIFGYSTGARAFLESHDMRRLGVLARGMYLVESRWYWSTMFLVPLWTLFFLFTLQPSCALCVGAWRLRRRRAASICGKCDYDLTGNVSGVCPECGTAVESSATANKSQPF